MMPKIYPQMDTNKHLIPKVYIMGEQDHIFLGSVKKDTVKDIAATLHIIKGCGHVCNIEKHDEFNRVAIQFFKERETEGKKLILSEQPQFKKCSITA